MKVRLSKLRFVGRTFALVALVAGCLANAQDPVGRSVSAETTVLRHASEPIRCSPGPWGDIEYYYTYLQASDRLIELVNVPSAQSIWRFPEHSRESVENLVRRCNIGGDLETRLLEDSFWQENGDETRLHPSTEVVSAMGVDARARIYRELRRWKENPFHWAPVVIESGTVREWFAKSGLREPLIAEIERLAYPIGEGLAFSDVPLLIGNSLSDQDDRQIMKSMTRTRTLLMRLKVTAESDLDALRDYWSVGFSHTDVLSLIETMAMTEDGGILDITHLLPSMPRKHLYTFPPVSMGVSGAFPESLWTAVNFFSYQPTEPGFGVSKFLQIMEKHFEPIEAPYRYGDILLIRRGEGRGAMQACVYIADDIIFTKNGRQMLRPWVLEKIDGLKARISGGPDSGG